MPSRFLNNVSINDSYTLPAADGAADQIITTDGAGQLSFIDQGDIVAGEADKAKSVILRVKNSTLSAMTKGQVICENVSISPPSGNLIEVALADNNAAGRMPALGILNEDLDAAGGNNDEGDAIMFGKVSGIDTSAFSVGDEVFVSDVPGGLTTTKPTGVKYIQKVGVVIRDDNTNGTIEVFGAGRVNDVPTPLYVDHANQRLGIGVINPTEKLDVDGDVGINKYIVHNGDTDTKFGFVAEDNFAITTNNAERLRVTSGGSVGIGTNNPGAKLDVEGNAVIGSTLNTATGVWSVAIGNDNTASGLDALATGELTTASGRQSFSGGFDSTASGDASFAVGGGTLASGENAFSANGTTVASGISSSAFGAFSDATGTNSFATGGNTTASGESSFSTGVSTNARGLASIASGQSCNTAIGASGAFAGGTVSNANANFSIAYGDVATASGRVSQAFGYIVNATGQYSFAQGFNNTASNTASAAFGQQNTVSGQQSIASGFLNTERNPTSATFGAFNGQTGHSATNSQFMFGRYLNVPRNSTGSPSQGCVVVGEHNAYSNRPNVKFAVGTGVGVGAEADSFTVLKDGNVLMEQIVNKNYSSDSAAASGGVPVGGVYHTNGDLKIRRT